MESRGDIVSGTAVNRPAIARRSCDHCRVRKIGCDRGSPCSNCVSARLNCAYSTVSTKVSSPSRRVMITAQYEQKIDDIARDIDGIKQLLQGLDHAPDAKPLVSCSPYTSEYPIEEKAIDPPVAEPEWDYSGHIADFLRTIVNDRDFRHSGPEQNAVISSIQNILNAIDGKNPQLLSSLGKDSTMKRQSSSMMPPLDAAVAVLRWAKAHEGHTRMVWISRVLPLDMFSDICRKVYFAVDDYNEIDFILANGYLSYVFAEHVSESSLQEYREYCYLCRENLHAACTRLPLVLPPTLETIAALVIGAFNCVENSRISLAWTFVSNAANLCQTLGYHRARPRKHIDASSLAAQARLFWTVYRMEKGLSLRLGRSSTIRDIDVTIPFDRQEERHSRLGSIQGKVWDLLYSPTSLTQKDINARGQLAEGLARELRELMSQTHSEISEIVKPVGEASADSFQHVYLQSELVCQSSLLALILRAIPPRMGSLDSASDECVAVAREVLDLHQRCVTSMHAHGKDPFMLTKYLSWSVVHHPFVPFSILFTRSVQLQDNEDLARLERFAASLRPAQDSGKTKTSFHRLYELLCQAARLYIGANTLHLTADPTLSSRVPNSPDEIEFTNFDTEAGTVVNEIPELDVSQQYTLSDWYFENQQLMSILDDNITF